MKGKQNREEPLFACVRLEELIPQDHILRKIDRWINFSSVHEKTAGLYSHTGRPSVDPEVLIRMMVIGYLYGITSERRLCREVQVNLAYRWFCGLSLEDKVPDHSTFSKNRHGRFAGNGLFRQLFYDVVRQAKEHGLVKGKHLTVDATMVQADASLESLEEIVIPFSAEEYLQRLEKENAVSEENEEQQKPKKLSNDTHCSRTDPDAKLFSKQFEKTQLAYSDNILMDNTKGIILDVEVTEPNLHQEGQVAGEMIERSRFTHGIEPETLGADAAYGAGAAVRRLCEAGVKAHIPVVSKKSKNTKGVFGKKDFTYDRERDELICPAGCRLRRRTIHRRNRQVEYVAKKEDCSVCRFKPQCTRVKRRVASRHLDQDYLDWAEKLRVTPQYRISQRLRKTIERLFAEAKEQMGLRRARRRGHANLTEQCVMTAMVQNMKRIVAHLDDRCKVAVAVVSQLKVQLCRLLCRILAQYRFPWLHRTVIMATT